MMKKSPLPRPQFFHVHSSSHATFPSTTSRYIQLKFYCYRHTPTCSFSLLPLDTPLVSSNEWHNLVVGKIEQALATDPIPVKSTVVNYQNLELTYSANDLAKNKHQLDMTDILNAILQMAYNKIYIPLLMMTT